MRDSTIDDLISNFLARANRDRSRWKLTEADVSSWEQVSRVVGKQLFDHVAVRLADRFIEGELSFDDCSAMTRSMERYILRELPAVPNLFWEIFIAFDAGEFRHSEDPEGADPIEVHTKPALAVVLAKLTESAFTRRQ